LEEAGYDALRAYLETAAARLQGNPDRDEILSDIERAIAEKFRARLGNYKNVVSTSEVADVLTEMGPIEGGAATSDAASSAGGTAGAGATHEASRASGASGPGKRLYRIHEGAMLGGVCNGLAAYFNLDPTIVRLLFVLLTVFWGAGILVYLVMTIVIPSANSPEKKAAAYGAPFTAQEFIRRAREGYYEAMKAFPDRRARREWRRQFKQEMRGWRAAFENEMRTRPSPCGWSRPPVHPGFGVTLPLLSALQGALGIVWLCAIVSLTATGTLFGAALPITIPVWVAILVMIFALGVLKWPIKAARRACYYGLGGGGGAWPLVFLLDALVWVAVVAVLAWLAFHFMPQLRDAVRHIPGLCHEAVNNVRDWWRQQ